MDLSKRRQSNKPDRFTPKKRRRVLVRFLACLVVFCTTYALILPAITLEKQANCGMEEHIHTDSCYTTELTCPLAEGEGHTHTEDCYKTTMELTCPLEEREGHTHTEECYETETTLTCPLEEDENHTHGEECYETETTLTCPLEECEGHTHTEECYTPVTELTCGCEESEKHFHTESCYERTLTCGKEEHTHTTACYSNPDADLESRDIWEATLPEKLTGVWADDLLAVAESQLGYAESSRNFQVCATVTKGYSRYGAWYGSPYGDWCAMFVSFCLHYAGIPREAFPYEANCETWVNKLTARKMFLPAGKGLPRPGDLIFFENNHDDSPDHVGLVTEVDKQRGVYTIEGNSDDKVAHRHYDWDDERLVGYGLLPENPNPGKVASLEDMVVDKEFTGETETLRVRVEAPEGAFPEGTVMEVKPVAAARVLDAVTDAVDGRVAHMDAADIIFTFDGEEIEPAKPIRVSMQPKQTRQQSDPLVVHVQDDGSAEQVDAMSTPAGETGVLFEADAFSVYALVYTMELNNVLSADGQTYDITVSYTDEAKIPADAELRAEEILPDTDEYRTCLADSAETLGTNAEDIPFARFFDIEILSGGKKIEPAAEVSVQIRLSDCSPEPMRIIHFADGGPDVLEAVQTEAEENAAELQFRTDGFSTYGVITAPPPTVNNLDGRSVRIHIGDRYVYAGTVTQDNITRLRKGGASQAATWTFESTGTPGVYNIYTMVNGQKRYMRFSAYNNSTQQAHVQLSSSPQALTVTQAGNGTYQIRGTVNGRTFYLNEFNGSGGTGFAGWYSQNDQNAFLEFAFDQPSLESNGKYMVLVKIGELYYIVRNDGSLEKVETPIDGDVNKIAVEDPMLWTYTGSNLYHPAEAAAYNNQNVASDYYYRYIDPRQDDALIQDSPSNAPLNGLTVSRRDLMQQATISYDQTNHTLAAASDPSKILKYVNDHGTYRIAGGDGEGTPAEVYFAKVHNPDLQIGEPYHTVNHIDISVEAVAAVNVPLAYGTYYYVENGQVRTLVVSNENHVTLPLSNNKVEVTKDDIKQAQIIAYTKDADGNQTILDDAYVINGYSANTENGASTDQVRIGGIFKVANLPPVANGQSGNNSQAIRSQRLANRIYYTVSTTKDIELPMVYNQHQLYSSEADALASLQSGYDVTKDPNAQKVRSTITLAASFDYWDPRNECPAIRMMGDQTTRNWRQGYIYSTTGDDLNNANSGMDFALGISGESSTSTVAISIIKYLVDASGHVITPNRELQHVFHIYRKAIDKNAAPNPIDEVKNLDVGAYDETQTQPDYETGYTLAHDKTMRIGDGGMGIMYDYDVPPGMVYVQEDKSEENLQQKITDTDGKRWSYSHTYLETEYVWRNDGIENQRHVSQTFTSEDEAYNSIPDVLGSYRDVGGIDRYNGFLEFYVYNVYEQEPTDIPVEKLWEHQNGSVATPPEGAKVTLTLGRYRLTEDHSNPVNGDLRIDQTVNGLPGGKTFQANYTVKRDGITIRTGSYDPSIGGALITNLPAGTYTVQISSAVDGYDVANTPASQEVAIVSGHTAENGNPAVAAFTTQVTPKQEAKNLTVRVTNSIDGASNYQNMTYTFPAGSKIVLNISRPGPGHNNSFHVNIREGNRTYSYTPPQSTPGQDDYAAVTQTLIFQLPEYENWSGTYPITIFHDWGTQDLWVNSVSLLAGRGAATKSANARALSSPARKAPATVSQSAAPDPDDESLRPDSPIPGMIYEVDPTWSTDDKPVTVELSGMTWRRILEGLQAADEQGNPYLYFIKTAQETGVPAGTVMTVDLANDGKILTSDGDNVLTVTNTIPNEPPDVTIQKVDELGNAMVGAIFSISKDGGIPEEIEITSGDGRYTWTALEPGTYTVRETAAPQGYKMIPNSTVFEITDSYDLQIIELPDGVSFDNRTFTLTAENQPDDTPGHLVVRKQWQDFNGDAIDHDGTLNLKLVQWTQGSPQSHSVNITFRCYGNGSGGGSQSQTTQIATRSGSGTGDMTIQWDWNEWTTEQPFTVTGLEGSTYETSWRANPNRTDGRAGRQTLTIHNITKDLNLVVTINNNRYDGTNNNLIYQPSFNSSTAVAPMVATGGTKTVQLGSGGVWSQPFNVSGSGRLSESSAALPRSYNGRACYYTIAEDSVPEGYAVSYSDNNVNGGVQSGVLTAYNRKMAVDLVILKVDRDDTSIRLNGADFTLRQLDQERIGNIDTRFLSNGRSEEGTTGGPGQYEGTLIFEDLDAGYYEIREMNAPDGYVFNADAAFYIRVTLDKVELLQKDEGTAAKYWPVISETATVALHEQTLTVSNKPGEELPRTGGMGAAPFTLLGSLLIAGALVFYGCELRRRRKGGR